ncbi:SLAP domain-containing protein [Companilactobacillus zhachilii]|uniref:SLAP domain-containing protein n=1 Tax=Companilactobacillus zhachilii TaxID=2304606 RepID=UPI001421DFC7|nr:SLAP domain-containing protein [Companilactobacillus zhachilii]
MLGITLCIFFQVITINASTVLGSDSGVQNEGNTPAKDTDETSDNTISINVDQHYDDGKQAGKNIVMEIPINEIGTENFTNRMKEAGISSTKLLKKFPGILASPSKVEPNITSIINGMGDYIPARASDFGNTGVSFISEALKYNEWNNFKSVTGFSLVYLKPIKVTINQVDSSGRLLGENVSFCLDLAESLDNVNEDIDGKIQEVSDQLISEGAISNESDITGSYYIETDQNGNRTKFPITKDSLDKDISTLQNDYGYKELSPIPSENGKSVTKALLQNLALIGIDYSQPYISTAESHEGKSIEIHLVYQPKKNSNSDNGAKNHESSNSGSSSSVSRNIDGIEDTIATYTEKPDVKVYDYDGNLITDRKLASGSNWYTDELMQLNGTKYYRVATNQWVKASDIYLYYNRTTKVRVNSDTLAELVTDEGKAVTDRALQKSSNWYTDEYKYINDIKYYRVATNEFVSTNDVQEY